MICFYYDAFNSLDLNSDDFQEALTTLQSDKTEWNCASVGRDNNMYKFRFVEKVFVSKWHALGAKMSLIVISFVSRLYYQ